MCWLYLSTSVLTDIGSLTEAISLLLREEAVCQATGDTDGEEDDEDCEHDEILMDAVTDLLPALAKCMGPAFEPILRQQFEPLMKFAVRIASRFTSMSFIQALLMSIHFFSFIF